jgi:uncharacterized protein
MITSLYASLIALLLLILSARVILFRRNANINLGHGDNVTMERCIRAQANLTEYAPIALILLALLEASDWPIALLHGLGILLVFGRTLHGWALSFTSSNSFARVSGMAMTLIMVGISAILCFLQFFLTSSG